MSVITLRMAISAARALLLIICITYTSIVNSYVVIKDKNTTSDDDDPFTVHHVDEVEKNACL